MCQRLAIWKEEADQNYCAPNFVSLCNECKLLNLKTLFLSAKLLESWSCLENYIAYTIFNISELPIKEEEKSGKMWGNADRERLTHNSTLSFDTSKVWVTKLSNKKTVVNSQQSRRAHELWPGNFECVVAIGANMFITENLHKEHYCLHFTFLYMKFSY